MCLTPVMKTQRNKKIKSPAAVHYASYTVDVIQQKCKMTVKAMFESLLKGGRLLRKLFTCGQNVKDVELRSVSNCPWKRSL